MRRRSRAGGGSATTRRGKAVTHKRNNGPKAARHDASAAIGSETEVARLTRELREALEQQTATSEVLRVISTSPGDLEPVFETMLENAVRICEATFGNIYRWDGAVLRMVATHNMAPAFADYRRRSPVMRKVPGRMLETKSVVHIADLAATRAYAQRNPETVAAVELGGIRTTLAVPILKDNDLIGLRAPSSGNASRNSLSSRVSSMAMTAWAAKFFTSAICLSEKGRTSWRPNVTDGFDELRVRYQRCIS